jgi:hypothetical protein
MKIVEIASRQVSGPHTEEGTGTIFPRTIRPRTIRPRTLRPRRFYISARFLPEVRGTILRVWLG